MQDKVGDLTEYYMMLLKGLVYGLSPILVVLAVLMACQIFAFKAAIRAFGYNAILYTGVIGTSLHEIAHAFMCVLFRHKITEVKLFKPDNDGTLGYVNFSYNPASLYQRIGLFFVGLAPFFMALVYFFLTTYFFLGVNLLSGTEWVTSYGAVVEDLRNFIYIVLNSGVDSVLWSLSMAAVVLHMMPSPQDLKGARTGAVMILMLYLVIVSSIFVYSGTLEWVHEWIFEVSLTSVLYLSKLMLTFSVFLLIMAAISKAFVVIMRK
ncbi:hypothetical protein [Alteromonas macleodii]|uniref:hypothetical protein n=1 Tax=Alteromonas macleodii TaxID=28108 RepID=UPI00313FF5F5